MLYVDYRHQYLNRVSGRSLCTGSHLLKNTSVALTAWKADCATDLDLWPQYCIDQIYFI